MKIAVISFSGNVGKSTIARHLLLPRIPQAELLSVESLNADDDKSRAIRGSRFGELHEYLQTIDHAVVDIGASNVEDLLALMRRYRGSHENFDAFVIPSVAATKQQKDTMATLADLSRMGIPPERLKLVFNMVEDDEDVEDIFFPLLSFLRDNPIAHARSDCKLPFNEIYRRMQAGHGNLFELAADDTDYKAAILKEPDKGAKIQLARRMANRQLALGAIPELDACFAALELGSLVEPAMEQASLLS